MADDIRMLHARVAEDRRVRHAAAATAAPGGVPRVELQLAAFARDLSREVDFKKRILAGMERLGRLGTFVADLQENSIVFSEGAHEIAGVDPDVDPLSFRRYVQLVHPDDRVRVAAELQDVVSGLLELNLEHDGEHRLVRASGGTVWIRTRIEAISDGDGEIDFVIGVIQDVTDEKRSRAELMRNHRVVEARVRQLEQMQEALAQARDAAEAAGEVRSRFLALMDGEMRTPMNSILGVLRMLEDHALPAEVAEMLRGARASGEALRSTLNNVLDLSELEAGAMPLEEVSFSLPAMLDDLEQSWKREIEAAGLRFESDLADDVPMHVLGDRQRLRQILTEFVTNALRVTDKGGITLRAHVVRRSRGADELAELQFEIEDTGPGIPDADRAALEQAWQHPGSGRGGLGLATAHALARHMGGAIGVQRAEYRGACFWVRLPMRIDRAVVDGPEGGEGGSLSSVIGRAPRVLLAEDVPLNQMIARHLVEGFGCVVDVAGNGVEVLEALDAAEYDLVLMDVSMPVLDGIGATRRIRARKDGVAELPIVAVTAYVRKDDVEQLEAAGFDVCVAKPLDRAELHEAMRTLLAARVGAIEPAAGESDSDTPMHAPGDAPPALRVVGDPEPAHAADGPREAAPEIDVGTRVDGPRSLADLVPIVGAETGEAPSPAPEAGPKWDMNGPLIDERMLEDLFEFLPAGTVESMLGKLDDALESVVSDAAEAVADEDADALGRIVHGINGYAGNLGAVALVGLAKTIEHAARSGRGEAALELAARLPVLVDETLEAFAALRAQRTPRS